MKANRGLLYKSESLWDSIERCPRNGFPPPSQSDPVDKLFWTDAYCLRVISCMGGFCLRLGSVRCLWASAREKESTDIMLAEHGKFVVRDALECIELGGSTLMFCDFFSDAEKIRHLRGMLGMNTPRTE